jgi:hypothetical protein
MNRLTVILSNPALYVSFCATWTSGCMLGAKSICGELRQHASAFEKGLCSARRPGVSGMRVEHR